MSTDIETVKELAQDFNSETELVDPESLDPHPENEDIYGEIEVSQDFIGSIQDNIWQDLIVTQDGRVISGHRRRKAAIKGDVPLVPVKRASFVSDDMELLALLELNRYRDKTPGVKGNEMEKYKGLEQGLAKEREEWASDETPSLNLDEGSKGRTLEKLGDRVNIGKDTARKYFKVHEALEHDNEEVRELAKEMKSGLDSDDESFHSAYTEIKKKKNQIEKEEQREERIEKFEDSNDDIEVHHGDFNDIDFETESFDHIVTDPPYPGDHIELWSDLSHLADDVLKPGGFCVAYSGKYHLPDVIERMGEELEYYWQCILVHEGPGARMHPRNLRTGYKPILVFQKPPVESQEDLVSDIVEGTGREKDSHEWQQAEDEMADILEKFTSVNDRILDPMAGSGTTLLSCREMKRRCVGVEEEQEHYNKIRERLGQNVGD